MARRQGLFDDLVEIGSKLPWRAAVLSAAVIFVVCHVIAIGTVPIAAAKTLADLGTVVQRQIAHQAATIFQYLLPIGLLIGAMLSYIKQSRTNSLFSEAQARPKTAITSMNWREFERLVGEAFRRQGFTVTGFGGNGPDGGVDLGLAKNGERFLVQCKHWRKRQVGVTVVRELKGVMSVQGARGGFVVAGGEFSREARQFADSCAIKLIDGAALEELIGSSPAADGRSRATDGGLRATDRAPMSYARIAKATAPSCPRCGTSMVERKAKQGKFAGQPFWGCQQYPKCSGILQIS
jgi:restriction system protein